jgi:ferredoxin
MTRLSITPRRWQPQNAEATTTHIRRQHAHHPQTQPQITAIGTQMTHHSFIRSLAFGFACILATSSLSVVHVHAFLVPIDHHQSQSSTKTSTTSINNWLKDAFSNDESLIGTAKNAGLSNGPKYNDQVSVNGKSIPNVVVDQKISQVCNAARVKVPYNCQNGECGTCTVKMNGKKVRACVSKVPAGKCAIQTL